MTAILGGTFDPPHNGHVALARRAQAQFHPERLVVVVAERPGHRTVVLDPETRVRLARAAFPGLEVELDAHPRTVDLLEERPYSDPLFVVGADEFADFLTWKEPNRILELARLGVATRPGYPRERLDAVLERLDAPERVTFFELEPRPISSSDVRERVARGAPIDGLVPPAVADLVRREDLYRR
ncbi:MAG TPA: nicotinate-nicotinamide nucleotide adenylyltransferase [Gaiellaceae bacterium]